MLDLINCRFEDNVTMPAIVRSGGFVFSLQGGGAAIANEAGATLTMTGCTLTGNSTSDGGGVGGAILNQGTAALIDCSLSGNIAPDGGAIMNAGGVLALIGCRLEDNTAPPLNFSYGGTGASGPGSGGAIFNSNGRLSLVDCTLTGNSANDGGAIDNEASYGVSALSLTDCTLSGNTAVVYDGFDIQQPSGGAIANLAYLWRRGHPLAHRLQAHGQHRRDQWGLRRRPLELWLFVWRPGHPLAQGLHPQGERDRWHRRRRVRGVRHADHGRLHHHRQLRRAGRRRCEHQRHGYPLELHHPRQHLRRTVEASTFSGRASSRSARAPSAAIPPRARAAACTSMASLSPTAISAAPTPPARPR